MELCVDRLLSRLCDRSVTFDLPPIETAADLPKATEAMLRAVPLEMTEAEWIAAFVTQH